MKLKYSILSIIAMLAMFVSCSDQDYDRELEGLQVSTSYVSIPMGGGETTIQLNTKAAWEVDTMYAKVPSWLTVTPSGVAGASQMTFSAAATHAGRSTTLKVKSGEFEKLINVVQGSGAGQATVATCAQVIAAADGKIFRVAGKVQKVTEWTKYGNWYIEDETGSFQIYGTTNFKDWTLEAGDEVVVEGPKKTYNGSCEIENGTIISVTKSLIKVDSVLVAGVKDGVLPLEGGEAQVYITCKGQGLNVSVPESAKEWLSISSIKQSGETAVVTFKASENAADGRTADLTFNTSSDGKDYSSTVTLVQNGALSEISIADFNAKADNDVTKYKISGVVTKIASDLYGNIYIKDATGEAYIYGVLDADGKSKNFASLGIKEGDIVTLITIKTSHKGSAQGKNATVDNHIAVKTVTAAEFNAAPESADQWYRVTGTIGEFAGQKYDLNTYGNLGLTDETGSIYVYGVSTGWNGETKKFSTLGVGEGDKITVIGKRSAYKGAAQMGSAFFVSKAE